jgi:uncharacterized membrane protein YadS
MSALSRSIEGDAWGAAGRLLPGLALSAGLGWLAIWLAEYDWVQAAGLSGLSLAIVLGMLVGNLGYARIAAQAGPGWAFPSRTCCAWASCCTACG